MNQLLHLKDYDGRRPLENTSIPSGRKETYGLSLEDVEGVRGSPNRVPVIDKFKKDFRNFLEERGAHTIYVGGTYLNAAQVDEEGVFVPNQSADIYYWRGCMLVLRGDMLAKAEWEQDALRDSSSRLELMFIGEGEESVTQMREEINNYLKERKANEK